MRTSFSLGPQIALHGAGFCKNSEAIIRFHQEIDSTKFSEVVSSKVERVIKSQVGDGSFRSATPLRTGAFTYSSSTGMLPYMAARSATPLLPPPPMVQDAPPSVGWGVGSLFPCGVVVGSWGFGLASIRLMSFGFRVYSRQGLWAGLGSRFFRVNGL